MFRLDCFHIMKYRLLSFLLIVCVVCGMHAQVYTPAEMPNVQVADLNQYVSDPGHLLSSATAAEVNSRLKSLREQTTVEMVVAIPPEIGDESPNEWCEQLFTLWGIGKTDKDNGVLLMISPGSRSAFIMPGYGVEGVLTDIACNNIFTKTIVPAMRDNDLDKAVLDASSLIVTALEDPAVAEELRSSEEDNFSVAFEGLDPAVIWTFIRYVAGAMLLLSVVMFCFDCYNTRKYKSNYTKAEFWRSHLVTYFWLGLLSVGAGLVVFILAFLRYRFLRTRRIKCSTCGAMMHRLPEDKDNELLSDSQDFEEKLNTVDYDVWECPECGTIERFPFRTRQKKYTECPSCHTVAMCLDHDAVIRPATIRSEGVGEKVYECRFCHYRDRRPYRIPRKEDPSAALAAAAAIGSMGRGGHGGGGGGFGGGFGGGATGGGGAGGSW